MEKKAEAKGKRSTAKAKQAEARSKLATTRAATRQQIPMLHQCQRHRRHYRKSTPTSRRR
ncbi:hypothetical protein BDV97DRAFT_346063 [Delphinella strobiligena]|nr:hypothetical protein BDV97DRAFT_346063 [Delphinella strobiligena]